MTHETPDDEIEIDEAIELSGLSRRTLMRLKATGKIAARTEALPSVQRQRRLLFRRSEIESLRGSEG